MTDSAHVSGAGCSHCSPVALMMDRLDAYERAVAALRNARDDSAGGVLPASEITPGDVLQLAMFLAGEDF